MSPWSPSAAYLHTWLFQEENSQACASCSEMLTGDIRSKSSPQLGPEHVPCASFTWDSVLLEQKGFHSQKRSCPVSVNYALNSSFVFPCAIWPRKDNFSAELSVEGEQHCLHLSWGLSVQPHWLPSSSLSLSPEVNEAASAHIQPRPQEAEL